LLLATFLHAMQCNAVPGKWLFVFREGVTAGFSEKFFRPVYIRSWCLAQECD